LGQYAPGLFGIGGGFSLDFGYNGDDSGFGIGSPIGGGDPWGAWQIPLKNFGWSTTTQTIDQNGDPTTVDVSTYGPLDDSFGLLLMSGGGGPNVQAQIQKGGLVANLLLSDADCAKFLKSIMTQAGYIPDLDAFKTNLNAAKFVPAPASEKPNYPDVVAQVHGGTNTVQVFQPGSSQLGQVFLHETFHTNAYDITDAGLAQYATGSHVPTPPNATNKQKQDINNKNSDIASKAFHDNCDVKKVKP
jgi:hypothetical protein